MQNNYCLVVIFSTPWMPTAAVLMLYRADRAVVRQGWAGRIVGTVVNLQPIDLKLRAPVDGVQRNRAARTAVGPNSASGETCRWQTQGCAPCSVDATALLAEEAHDASLECDRSCRNAKG